MFQKKNDLLLIIAVFFVTDRPEASGEKSFLNLDFSSKFKKIGMRARPAGNAQKIKTYCKKN